ncbi:alkaline phosphatase [Rhizobium sp. FKY42]|uniref:alkaline phosphatase n=1 Tax=Rhizobium sp. FKY42 TaxID=2562310 RepID=UPI001FEEB23E|nr:alkaline phosphatase [Rhizobium sp. FKY42]
MRDLLKLFGLAVAVTVAASQPSAIARDAKHVIVMIADGMGPQSWDATTYYEYGGLGLQSYEHFDVKMLMSTYSLGTVQEPISGEPRFDARQLYADVPAEGTHKGFDRTYPNYFVGYQYARMNPTDSAAAATAMATGKKVFNGSINWSTDGTPLTHIGELAVQAGRTLGVVTTVEWTNATPAAFLAHNVSRRNQRDIAREIVEGGLGTVIMGAGHPAYDHDGLPSQPSDDRAFEFVGGKDNWTNLVSGKTPYLHIETKADFERLTRGDLDLKGKSKVIGTAQARQTLQFLRHGERAGQRLSNQPTLATMTSGALRMLSKNGAGFFMMVEGGATDWAANENNLARLIEEHIEFNRAVAVVVDWIRQNSSWEDSLVIVTADHGNGLLLGPDSDLQAYSPIKGGRPGQVPQAMWHSDDHTNELVPLFAKGKGADRLLEEAKTVTLPGGNRVAYVDNTEIFRTMLTAMGIKK